MSKRGYTIFNKHLANRLCKEGFEIIGTGINNQKPWLYVYFFKDTEEFQIALRKLKGEYRYGESGS